MIPIDGSQGEGGGQILRSSLALSIATRTPFRMTRIRAGRARPGLMRQHLTCVQAAAAISSADVTGASVGSQEITFSPGPVCAGNYHFPIGTAGGTTLVLQAILPALLRADGPSRICVEGGTHNLAAPPFEFFDRAFLPLLARSGANVRARLERHGFYPAGGGRIVVEIDPTTDPRPLHLPQRGRRLSARAATIVSRLPRSIAEREADILRERLALAPTDIHIIDVRDAASPGNAAAVELTYEHLTEVFSVIGEIGKSAESVARELSDDVRDYIASERPVGPHLADQLMVPLALLAGGSYSTGPLTEHSRTNIATAAMFGVEISTENDHVRVRAL
jgi:RNA 3'-terminal phosphate cyclase (ATP)